MERYIWDTLIKYIGNPYGVAAVMGNLYAESGLNPRNLEQWYETKLGLTDDEYTRAVDEGKYIHFVSDGAGYGIAQWTYPTRKAALLAYAGRAGTSVGDLGMQLAFLLTEMGNMPAVRDALKYASSVREASDIVMREYEKPKDMSEAAKDKRCAYGHVYFERYSEVVEMPTNHAQYIDSKWTHYISNSGHDERNQYHGGQAGDQYPYKEYALIPWYNRPWTVVLRHPKKEVAMKIAQFAIDAALNNNIGYDQYQRNTMWRRLCEVGYEPAKIKTPCEADCTASTTAIVKSVGMILKIDVLAEIELDTYSGNMKARFVKAGFKVLTASKYLTGYQYLQPGDILLYEGHHAAINVTNGKYSNVEGAGVVVNAYKLGDRVLKNGMEGTDVKELQKALQDLGYSLGKWGIDGDFGDCTEMAVRQFQTQLGLKVDGKVGANTVAALNAAVAALNTTVVNPAYVVITGGSCYVREEPKIAEDNIIGVALENTKLIYDGKTTNGWHMVSFKNRSGWVSSKYGRLAK